MSKIKVLSLDLDWFDTVPRSRLKGAISRFFALLKKNCTLPSSIALLTEHHYLYPYCERLLRSSGKRKIDMINIDEHHDFYNMGLMSDFEKKNVTCANFFGFMAEDDILSKYTWITNDKNDDPWATWRPKKLSTHYWRGELIRELGDSDSRRIRNMRRKVKVHGKKQLWGILTGKKFDGFAIIKSMEHTHNQDIVFSCVNNILRNDFGFQNGFTVGKHRWRKNFKYHERHEHGAKIASLVGI